MLHIDILTLEIEPTWASLLETTGRIDELNRYRSSLHLNESQETELVHLKYQLNTVESELEKQNKLYYDLTLIGA